MAQPNSIFRSYYYLTKPGIVYGNMLPAAAGFFLASRSGLNLLLLITMLLGLALVIASACAYNNVLDRRIDAAMARTRRRALVSGAVSVRSALIYATVLGTVGFALLALGTNAPTVGVAAAGIIDYVLLYGWAKRHTPLSTLVGSVSGAVPPVVGYVAVTGRLDTAAWLLFFILVTWQMPHFYAIAIFRRDDYAAARLPVLPVVREARTVKIQMLLYIIAFTLAVSGLTVSGYTGFTYLVIALILALTWLAFAVRGFRAGNNATWARQLFFVSLIILTVECIAISVGPILP